MSAKAKLVLVLPNRSIFGEVQDTNKPRVKPIRKFSFGWALPRRNIFGEAQDNANTAQRKAEITERHTIIGKFPLNFTP
ncbi:MAG: hypothetical protein NC324_04205 [Bacteroides sp.]|nr:hypothetical protein [Bacteroides sp.]